MCEEKTSGSIKRDAMCRDQKVFRRAAVKRKLGEKKETKMEKGRVTDH